MKHCIKCGSELPEGARACSQCGEPVSAGGDFADKVNDINNTADTTGEYSSQDIQENKGISIAAYVLFFLPLCVAPKSKFARFHANQGLVLLIAAGVLEILSWILGLIVSFLGILLGWVFSVVIVVLLIIGMVNASKGLAKELPIIGGIKILK